MPDDLASMVDEFHYRLQQHIERRDGLVPKTMVDLAYLGDRIIPSDPLTVEDAYFEGELGRLCSDGGAGLPVVRMPRAIVVQRKK